MDFRKGKQSNDSGINQCYNDSKECSSSKWGGKAKIDRIISGKPDVEDAPLDVSLRPRSLSDFDGQTKVKDNLNIAIAAAKGRGEALDHLLFYGPPGLGKTTLAYVLSAEIGQDGGQVSGALDSRAGGNLEID